MRNGLRRRIRIHGGVDNAGFEETATAELARVASAAGSTTCRGVVARDRRGVVDAEGGPALDDFGLGHGEQGGTDVESNPVLRRRDCCDSGEMFECLEEYRPAVRVSRVVDLVGTDKKFGGADDLGNGQQ